MRSFIVNENDSGQRLDKFLSKLLKTLPMPLLYKYLRKKRIKVNSKAESGAYRLQKGDSLELYLNDDLFDRPSETSLLNLNSELNIVYEDENILLVDKEPGLLVHEDDGEEHFTLINYIKAYLIKSGEYDPAFENSFTPSLCNRIDRNTGGIVIAAKNAKTLRVMNEKIKHREIEKFYLLLAVGILPQKQGKLKGYLTRNFDEKTVRVYKTEREGSVFCETHYRVLKEKSGLSLVEAELITGRTHQIRAQFAAHGFPLLGDGKYGHGETNRAYGRNFQALYSYKLVFSFKSDAGHLNYLKDKTFEVKNVPFLKSFDL